MLHSLVIKFSFPPRNETLLDPANGFRRVGISMGRPSSLLRTSSLRPSFAIQSPARGPRLVNGVVVHIWRYPTAPKNSALGGSVTPPPTQDGLGAILTSWNQLMLLCPWPPRGLGLGLAASLLINARPRRSPTLPAAKVIEHLGRCAAGLS